MEYPLPDKFYEATPEEEERINEILRLHSQLATVRYNFENQWEETASLIWPDMRNTFRYGSYSWPGQKKTQHQVDASGMAALGRFAAICDSLLTPQNQIWQALGALDPRVKRDRASMLWLEATTRRLFQYRYAPMSGFVGQNHVGWQQLGAFGGHYMFVDALQTPWGTPAKGIRYRQVPVGEVYLIFNHQGVVCGFIRWLRLTAYQAYLQFGPKRFPRVLAPALQQGSQVRYNFLQHVCAARDYDPGRLDYKRMPWSSCYISVEGRQIMEESGYRAFPLSVGRYAVAPGEDYGRGPAQQVLPALKTLNAEKTDFLTVGHRAANPTYLSADDGLVDSTKLVPGVINPGGVDPTTGRPLVVALEPGNVQVTKEMMDEERGIINDAFLVSLFQILEQTPQMSATEVIERVNEKGILLAPTLGRQVESLALQTARELDILASQNVLDPMPRVLREAAEDAWHVVPTNPLARAARAQEAAGIMRTVESLTPIAQITGDVSVFDFMSFDRAGPMIAEIQGVPVSVLASPQEMAAKKQGRAQSQQTEQQIKMAPAKAAMMKAQAVAAKAPAAPAQIMNGLPPPVLTNLSGVPSR